MNSTTFKPGDDSRRNRAGRPPSARTLAAQVRNTLGRDAPQILERVRVGAAAGDPDALGAAAVLLAAAVGGGGTE